MYRRSFGIQLELHTALCVDTGDKSETALTEYSPNPEEEKITINR